MDELTTACRPAAARKMSSAGADLDAAASAKRKGVFSKRAAPRSENYHSQVLESSRIRRRKCQKMPW